MGGQSSRRKELLHPYNRRRHEGHGDVLRPQQNYKVDVFDEWSKAYENLSKSNEEEDLPEVRLNKSERKSKSNEEGDLFGVRKIKFEWKTNKDLFDEWAENNVSKLKNDEEDLFDARGNNSERELKNNEEDLFEVQEKNSEWKLKRTEKLQVDLLNLLIGGKHSDVVLKVEGREFKAHRSILSARSDYFSTMFDHDTSEKQTGVVTIEDSDPDAFECLLQYIYTGEASISPVSFVIGLYTVADRYQVLELKEECLKQIKSNLSVDSFCDVARMSLVHPELNLTEITSQYFTKNASDIVSTSEWETFMEENTKLCNKLLCSTLKATPKKTLHPLT